MDKPTRKEDLLPPFTAIGEGDWAERIRKRLLDYGVPLPEPISEAGLRSREEQLGLRLPEALRSFLREIGPVDLDGIRFYRPDEIGPTNDIWFREHLRGEDRARLSDMLAIAEYASGDPIALEPGSGRCCLLSHDPPGFWNWMDSFDDLVKIGLIDLSWGYWGWPNAEVAEMAHEVKRDLFGKDVL
jgi:hypothetical protein